MEGYDMVKKITLILNNENWDKIKNHKIPACDIYQLCTVEEKSIEEFLTGLTKSQLNGKDGSRFIIMNNQNNIVYAFYSAVASYQFKNELNLDLDKILIRRIREELGFERKY